MILFEHYLYKGFAMKYSLPSWVLKSHVFMVCVNYGIGWSMGVLQYVYNQIHYAGIFCFIWH